MEQAKMPPYSYCRDATAACYFLGYCSKVEYQLVESKYDMFNRKFTSKKNCDMTQEEKQLLLIDLCARLPYRVICQMEDELIISDSHFYDSNLSERYIELFRNHKDFYIKPYLRPLSSMTEEEVKEIAILHDIKDILSVKVTSDYIDVIVDDGFCSTERRTIWYDEIVSSVKCFDFLTAHHFDYRGLIEKGLAIEAPEGMYN